MNDKNLAMLAALPGLLKSRDAIEAEINEIRTIDGRFNDVDSIATLPGLFLSRDQLTHTIEEIKHLNGSLPRPGSLFAKRSHHAQVVDVGDAQREKWQQQIEAPTKRGRPPGREPGFKVSPEGRKNMSAAQKKRMAKLKQSRRLDQALHKLEQPKEETLPTLGTRDNPYPKFQDLGKEWMPVNAAASLANVTSGLLRTRADAGELRRTYKQNAIGGHPTPLYHRDDLEHYAKGWTTPAVERATVKPAKKHNHGTLSPAGRKALSKAASDRWKLMKQVGMPGSRLMTNEELMAAGQGKVPN